MAGDSGPHMDTDSRKPRHPNLVFMDEEGGLRFWVHPSLPGRPEITDRIERHGGKVVDSIRPAYLAITDDEFCDNKELREHPLRTIGVMPQWVQDSIDACKIQDFEDYLVVYHRPDTEEGASGIESSPENELRAGTVMEVDGGDDNDSDPDRSSNEDSDWVVQAAKDFFSDSPRATLESFYRWCANKRKHRSEDYWKKFISEKPLQKTVDGIRNPYSLRTPSERKSDEPPTTTKQRVSKFPRGWSEKLRDEMVSHIALNPGLRPYTLWRIFHEKNPDKSLFTYWNYHQKFGDYFSRAVSLYLAKHKKHPARIEVTAPAPSHTQNKRHPSPRTPSVGPNSKVDEDHPTNRMLPSGGPVARSMRNIDKIPFALHERRQMQAFYAKMRTKCRSEFQVWNLFSQLHPSRSPVSYASHARRHPEIKTLGPTNHEGSVGDNEEDRETPERTQCGRKSPSHEGDMPDDCVQKNQLSTSNNRSDTEGRSQSQLTFSQDEWTAAIQWVMTRGGPLSVHANVESWQAFSVKNPSHNELEWIGLYYAYYDFFQGIEHQFTQHDMKYLC